ncbi:hypothetical protein CYMTET_36256, partial [Cymbomonas tetramitiformis]
MLRRATLDRFRQFHTHPAYIVPRKEKDVGVCERYESSKPTREEKKAGRRAAQAATVAAKGEKELEYFHACCAEAIHAPPAGHAKAKQDATSERQLFSQQGTQGINFDKYSKIKVEVSGASCTAAPPMEAFSSLKDGFPGFLARNIGLMRYERPTPIQRHAVPLALAGADLMCCAQTGSGKTCAFLLPICASISSAVSAPGHQ